MAGASATGTCPRCAAPVTVQPGGSVPRCTFCGTISMGSIEVEKAVLGNLDNRFQRKQMHEELLRRKEVLEINLGTIDPLARWTGGEPVWLSRKAALRVGGFYLFGFFLLGAGNAARTVGVLVVAVTTLVVIVRAISYSGQWQAYSAARATSATNHKTIQKLRADLWETEDLLRQFNSQGDSR